MLPKSNSSSNSSHNCCRLVRSDKSSRLLLPLARRSRPHLSSRCRRFLCPNCLNIKQKQEHDLRKILSLSSTTKNIFESMIEQENKPEEEELIEEDIPHEIQFSLISENEQNHLNNVDYDSSEMLIWKRNSSENSSQTTSIHQSYDTGSLTNHEKKLLLQEAIDKLRIVLNHRPTTTSIPENDLDKIEFTYRALQTTVQILSSSLDSL